MNEPTNKREAPNETVSHREYQLGPFNRLILGVGIGGLGIVLMQAAGKISDCGYQQFRSLFEEGRYTAGIISFGLDSILTGLAGLSGFGFLSAGYDLISPRKDYTDNSEKTKADKLQDSR
jgi:hypothetical protein